MSDDPTAQRGSLRHPAVLRVRVDVLDGADRGASIEAPRGRALLIGTGADVDLRLVDPAVSRYHVELRPSSDGIHVHDLGSSNGTWCGAVRVRDGSVAPGATLRVGDTFLRASERSDEAAPARLPKDEPIPNLIGSSPAMREVRATVRLLAQSPMSVLILGETGAGKEGIARALHALGPRRTGPFVVLDCGSIAPTLIASELFGHERGAFTGATHRHVGAFERARGGTLFLDEIGELPLSLQPALLGVLERRNVRRVGGTQDIDVDVRVVSATHRDLRVAANTGAFRPDLFFRLAATRLHLPPLRERIEDLEELIRHFAEELTGDAPLELFTAEQLELLRAHPWHGNVRELRNVVESALAFGRLDLLAVPPPSAEVPRDGRELPSYRDARDAAIRSFEEGYLSQLIRACRGNASEAARRARMDRTYLLELLRKHDLR